MTIDEFIEKLAETKGRWVIKEDGCIRSVRCRRCPLVFMAQVQSNSCLETAERRLNLSARAGEAIVDAADNMSRHDASLRERLIEATGAKHEN